MGTKLAVRLQRMVPLGLAITLASHAVRVKLASWNVYYKALDDAHGRAAIVSAIDAAGALDFVAVIEAAGDTPSGALAAWSNGSTTLSAMRSLTTVSRYETLALFYDAASWTPGHVSAGSFDVGRPYLLAPFSSRAQPHVSIWVFAVHLPHFLDTTVDPGAIMAQVMRNEQPSRNGESRRLSLRERN